MSYRGKTDRRYQDWHYSLPPDWKYIDLDGVDWCPRCREAWLLTETSKDPEKATSVMRRLAERAHVPAVLVLMPDGIEPLSDMHVIRWRFVSPSRAWQSGTLADWRVQLGQLRDFHIRAAHGEAA